MSLPIESRLITNVSCPFCGLACDDLDIRVSENSLSAEAKACERGARLFAANSGTPSANGSIGNLSAPLAQCVDSAAVLLREASQPLISGLAADVGGVRAALSMANRIGAIVDHMNSTALSRNLLVLQDSGWIVTTFAEVRSRADFVLIVGTETNSRFPRFAERLIDPLDSPFSDGPMQRSVVYLGARPKAPADARVLDCPTNKLGEVFGALRCLVANRPLQAVRVAGLDMEILNGLADEMRKAKYGVVAWAAADLDQPHGELIVQSICGLVSDLNETTRFAGLPLGGNDADVTANQVTLWQTGLPLRTGFGRGVPEYDAYHFGTDRLLAGRNADVLLWISAFDPLRLPPETDVPTIVLGSPAMRFTKAPAVFIPVATPGLHHAGHFFRSDGVMAIRLRKLADSPLPSVAEALTAIEQAL
jgi:formylmethanofuran dehydrogenase subunit B